MHFLPVSAPITSCLSLSNVGMCACHLWLLYFPSSAQKDTQVTSSLEKVSRGRRFLEWRETAMANIPDVRFSARVWGRSDCPSLGGLCSFQLSLTSVRTFWISPPQCVSCSTFLREKRILSPHTHWAWLATWPLRDNGKRVVWCMPHPNQTLSANVVFYFMPLTRDLESGARGWAVPSAWASG